MRNSHSSEAMSYMQEAMTIGSFLTFFNEISCVPVFGHNKEGTTGDILSYFYLASLWRREPKNILQFKIIIIIEPLMKSLRMVMKKRYNYF